MDKTDENKDRSQLLLELQQLREIYDRQKKIIARYERLYNNGKKPIADISEVLEAQGELVESLKQELWEKQEDFEVRNEEYEAQIEELRLSCESLSNMSETLRESEERFCVLADIAPVAVSLFQDGKVVYSNDACLAIMGYSREERLKMKYWDIVHPDSRKLARERIRAILEGDSSHKGYEYEVIRKDGEVRCVSSVGAKLAYHGKPAVIAVTTDVTDRMRASDVLARSQEDYVTQAEELKVVNDELRSNNEELKTISSTLQASERNLAQAQRLAHIGSWDWNMETGEMQRSEEFYRILGLEPPSRKPKHFSFISFVHPDDYEKVEKAFNEAFVEGKPHDFECRVFRADGSIRIVREKGEVVEFGESGAPLRLLGMFQDITEQRQAEEALRESERKFSVLAETSPAAILVYHGKKNLYANHATELLSGYTKEELLSIDYFDLIHPDQLGFIKDRAFALSKGQQVPQRYEIKVKTKSGEEKWIDVSDGFTDFEGSPAGIITAIDITERKRVEEALKEAMMQADLYLDLMGHDINNMHQIAMGYLELADNTPAGEEQAAFIKKSMEVLQRSARLINNVRKLQKLQDGMYQTHEVDIIPLLKDLQREYGSVPNEQIILNANRHEHCLVRANELIRDVYANLVSNAIKHNGDKSDITVDVEVIKDDGSQYCRVMVEDNGPGIPDDKKATVFNRTLKGSNKTKGMGLGLYIVKTLVDNYGGKVWVEDRVQGDPTKGARFVVMLPAIEK